MFKRNCLCVCECVCVCELFIYLSLVGFFSIINLKIFFAFVPLSFPNLEATHK